MTRKIKVLELFGGIGAPRKALEKIGIDFEVVDYVEIDKYAVKSYNAIYNENYNPQDVTEWDKDLEVDLIFHGSPCQDFSIAGKGKGGDKGSGTRSSLMWHTVRIVEKLKPKYVIWENVKAVINKNHIDTFNKYLDKMSELGYTNYYEVLNAKNYGIPQNRERVFVISILNKHKPYVFPKKEELKLKLKDVLEKEVNEKYFLSDKMIEYIVAKPSGKYTNNDIRFNREIANTINTGSQGQYRASIDNYLIPDTDVEIKILKKCDYLIENNKIKENDIIRHSYSTYRMEESKKRSSKTNDMAPTLDTRCDCFGIAVKNNTKIRIRKLTPLECWRLMGFDDESFYKADQVNSNSQLYKQAGNSIVVNVLEKIFTKLLMKGEENNG